MTPAMPPDITRAPAPAGFGLIIVGNEILDGRRQDSHFVTARDALKARNIPLRYAFVLPDDSGIIECQLRWAMARPEPFFCCGGIGATPDDLTRPCAARAAGLDLAFHPEGVEIIQTRFGRGATPERLRLVEFPAGAELIPNPFNQVPGFTVRNGHFLPGFPEMATPMMAWVLDSLYAPAAARLAAARRLPGAREGDLIPLMERFGPRHPAVFFSSLPRFTDDGGTEVELGLSGPTDAVQSALAELCHMLDEASIPHEPGNQSRM